MIRSMTAFATQQGNADTASWTWEVRSVNGRGLDVKVRLPDSVAALEAAVRASTGKVATRGTITIGLRLNRDQADGTLQIDPARMDVILEALDRVQERAFDKGVTLGQPTAADVLAQRGVLVMGQGQAADLSEQLMADFDSALAAMIEMRAAEGVSLLAVLTDQINQIETLTAQAVGAATARTEAVKTQMAAALARVMDTATGADPDRVAQELALLAVKSDITEEIDRLGAHVTAARDLLTAGGPVGRKLDFLTQEFNREANTLCSKAQDVDLTQIGLALKAVIDQMREQVQNVE
ncbi:YicC family protein [Octadecabacter sp. G9-8]|uniref:YicC family protein n=1 Tax=Octadecabacter dasysiphoniae TaxID=2909341 RepID=A0ABS9CTY5_9RHOB|nr:YicC/YloC family endoribonuclease [Octadecabacter dasysiphoniae]MCF2870700.1 YicC family protein [Octadecabacter dasysiphoniae]